MNRHTISFNRTLAELVWGAVFRISEVCHIDYKFKRIKTMMMKNLEFVMLLGFGD